MLIEEDAGAVVALLQDAEGKGLADGEDLRRFVAVHEWRNPGDVYDLVSMVEFFQEQMHKTN